MPIASLTWGILAIAIMLIGFMPLFGALNWLNIPFAGAGAIFSVVSITRSPEDRGKSISGLICCIVAMVLGAIRLVLGLGVL